MKTHWRRLALARQGLMSPQPFGKGLAGACRAIEHLGYVQIDSLSVVERAHHHTLWARVPGYRPEHLTGLIRERRVFEYWFHAASYLPMRDFRFALPRMSAYRSRTHHGDPRLAQEILARVRGEGPLRVRDLESRQDGPGNWWNWGPGRRALDQLFMQGDLMVRERNGIEKLYDLTENVLPAGLDLREPTLPEYAEHLLDTTLRAHGVVTWKQVLHLKTGQPLKEAMRGVIRDRMAQRRLVALHDDGLSDGYAEPDALERVPKAAASRVRLLSPFDNAVIHRDRLSQLFGFDYRLECYVPAPKRRFGYFCLPVIYGDRFIGRADCKAHRAEKRFEVLSLHLEDRTVDVDLFLPSLAEALQPLAAFNGCEVVQAEALRATPRAGRAGATASVTRARRA
ncbi:winged helix-turn-helix domain-containing protein [Caldimonas brevitalea]|uniref:Winged helix-turn-helix domain-containing protein n=1 Tax=Caldimonas brevitalea TaxID=413882 RepID=A0A0G3BU86_9BURK|nr:crosslink repair DNA glycosylase YcaQ family protein [Caldimonas brevitalea]AKJ30926.1 hypothetical protein AAW51_4235 [Caldimonas brevitalea]